MCRILVTSSGYDSIRKPGMNRQDIVRRWY
jgi:hypothetical protein